MIDPKEISKLAELSRITLSPEELKTMGSEIDAILAYIGDIKKVSDKVSNVEKPDTRNVFRDDSAVQESGLYTKDILKNAPQSEDGYIKVKKILT